jgi:hypothetical protein
MVYELRASLGNRTDIVDARYIRWLNWAMLDVCGFHKKRVFPPKRFHILEGKILLNAQVISGTVAAASDNSFTLEAGDIVAVADYYVDTVVKLTAYDETGAGTETPDNLLNQERLITAYDQATGIATVSEDWDVNPDEYTTYEIYRRYFDIVNDIGLNPRMQIWAFEKIEYAEDGSPLSQKSWEILTGADIISGQGLPTEFAWRGSHLVFNNTLNEDKVFRIYYYRYPTLLTETDMDAQCEVPEDWHEVIVQGGTWRGFKALMEPERSQEARELYRDMGINKITSFQIADGTITHGFKMRFN